MKKLWVSLLLMASSIAVCSTTQACESLEGAWELTYAVYKDQQGKVVQEIKAGGEKSLKILSQRHFSFITVDKDGKFAVAGAGTYALTGSKYTETVTFASLDRNLGKIYQFNCQMKDGLWIHTGSEDHLLIEEHWRRVE
jgi:hypothetical protein